MLKTVNTDERNQGPKNRDTYCFLFFFFIIQSMIY